MNKKIILILLVLVMPVIVFAWTEYEFNNCLYFSPFMLDHTLVTNVQCPGYGYIMTYINSSGQPAFGPSIPDMSPDYRAVNLRKTSYGDKVIQMYVNDTLGLWYAMKYYPTTNEWTTAGTGSYDGVNWFVYDFTCISEGAGYNGINYDDECYLLLGEWPTGGTAPINGTCDVIPVLNGVGSYTTFDCKRAYDFHDFNITSLNRASTFYGDSRLFVLYQDYVGYLDLRKFAEWGGTDWILWDYLWPADANEHPVLLDTVYDPNYLLVHAWWRNKGMIWNETNNNFSYLDPMTHSLFATNPSAFADMDPTSHFVYTADGSWDGSYGTLHGWNAFGDDSYFTVLNNLTFRPGTIDCNYRTKNCVVVAMRDASPVGRYYAVAVKDDLCVVNWSCSSYGGCSGGTKHCTNVVDRGGCYYWPFDGNLSLFDTACNTTTQGGGGSIDNWYSQPPAPGAPGTSPPPSGGSPSFSVLPIISPIVDIVSGVTNFVSQNTDFAGFWASVSFVFETLFVEPLKIGSAAQVVVVDYTFEMILFVALLGLLVFLALKNPWQKNKKRGRR